VLNTLENYIGITHAYGKYDCITLVQQFYERELGCSFNIPIYNHSRLWMKQYTADFLDEWAYKYGKKVSLTDAQNYDLISFKSKNSNLLIHFGLYIKPNRMLHVEEGKTSRVDQLSDYWLQHLHAIYRHDKMV
jgi:cell wall-associated NlpC family hydrolase